MRQQRQDCAHGQTNQQDEGLHTWAHKPARGRGRTVHIDQKKIKGHRQRYLNRPRSQQVHMDI